MRKHTFQAGIAAGSPLVGYALSNLNPLTCQFSSADIVRSWNNSDLKEAKWSFLIGTKYIGFLHIDSNPTLNFSIMTRSPLQEKAVMSIMDGIAYSLAKPLIANGYIFIPYAKNGLMLLKRSDKKVP